MNANQQLIKNVRKMLLPTPPLFVQWLEILVMLLPRQFQPITLLPEDKIRVINLDNGDYYAKKEHSYFQLYAESTQQSAGWFYLEAVLVRGSNRIAKIYTDLGRGYCEQDSIFIPSNRRGTIGEVVYLPNGLTNIRWSPMETVGGFTQSTLIFYKITKLESFIRRTYRAWSDIWRFRNSSLAESCDVSWFSPITNLTKAYAWTADLRKAKTNDFIVDYLELIKRNDTVTAEGLGAIKMYIYQFAFKPLVSIALSVYSSPVDFFKTAFDSVYEKTFSEKTYLMKNKSSNIVCVIPYYNGSKFIERALISIYKQTVLPDEIVVVDDGSRADEREFLIELRKKYSFHLIHKTNGGQGSARNAGVAESSSRYICFLDQDDFYLPRHNEILLKGIPADEPDFGWVYGDLLEADGDGFVKKVGFIKDRATHPKRYLITMLREDIFVLPSASLINRLAFEDVGGFDEQFTGYEDDDLFLRLFCKNWSNTFIDKSVTTWCINSESTSYSVKMSRSRFRYLKKLVANYPDDPINVRYYFRDLFMPRFQHLIITDAIKAKVSASNDCDELFDILKQYYEMVCQQGVISQEVIKSLKNQVDLVCMNITPLDELIP
jgi:glycosyltransferase involved in cell wall biosynthesis